MTNLNRILFIVLVGALSITWIFLGQIKPANLYTWNEYTRAGQDYYPGPVTLFTHEMTFGVLASSWLYFLVTAILGKVLFVNTIIPKEKLWITLSAGFLPGVIFIAAINRLITLLASNINAPVIIALCLMVLLFLFMRGKALNHDKQEIFDALWKVPLFIVGFLIFCIQYGDVHVSGDAYRFYSELVTSPTVGVDSLGKLPFFGLHYLEFAYMYPVHYGMLGGNINFDPLRLEWHLAAVSRLSAAAIIFCSFLTLKITRWKALLGTLFFFFGSTFLNPFNAAPMIIDNGTPVSTIMSTGRLIASISSIIAVCLIVNQIKQRSFKLTLRSSILAVLFGLGMSSAPIHLVFCIVFSLMFLFGLVLKEQISKHFDYLVSFSFLTFPLMPLIAYGFPKTPLSASLLLPFSILLFYGAFLIYKNPINGLKSTLTNNIGSHALIILASFTAGAIFLGGNLLLANGLQIYKDFGWEIDLIVFKAHLLSTIDLDSIGRSPICENPGAPNDGFFRYLNNACDLFNFGYRHALLICISSLSLLAFYFAKMKRDGLSIEQFSIGLSIILGITLFQVSLFVYDFTNNGVVGLAHWVKSRLMESWYQLTVFSLIALALNEFVSKKAFLILCFCSSPWLLGPLFKDNGIATQMRNNVAFFFDPAAALNSRKIISASVSCIEGQAVIEVKNSNHGNLVYFTTDGTLPNRNANVLREPFKIITSEPYQYTFSYIYRNQIVGSIGTVTPEQIKSCL